MTINLRQLLLDRAARGIGTGGGLLNTQATGGLLGNLNPLLLGASIIGSGMQGRDPFSSVLPAATQTAQLQQLLTPEEKERRIVTGADGFQYYADTGERVLPCRPAPNKPNPPKTSGLYSNPFKSNFAIILILISLNSLC